MRQLIPILYNVNDTICSYDPLCAHCPYVRLSISLCVFLANVEQYIHLPFTNIACVDDVPDYGPRSDVLECQAVHARGKTHHTGYITRGATQTIEFPVPKQTFGSVSNP